jgi:hypothetical protein
MRTIALLAVVAGVALAAPKKVVPDRDWTGIMENDKLSAEAPKDGLITDAKAFEKLWKAWRKDEKVPSIDFKKHFVVVTVSRGGPNKPMVSAKLDEGKMTIEWVSTLIGGSGFGYSIASFPREGVKQVGETKLP